jgi:hypothetical protein
MDWDNSPRTLNTELFKEGCGDDSMARGESVWVKKSTSDDGDEDDGKSSTKDLRGITDDSASSHGAKVGNHLCYGDRVGAKVVLVLEHSWVQILGSMGLENVSSRHLLGFS